MAPLDRVDVRQKTLLGAAWTFACLKQLVEHGCRSSTWFETTGPKGVLENGAGDETQDVCESTSERVFPLYHVLSDWCHTEYLQTAPCISSDRLLVEGSYLVGSQRNRLLFASMQSQPLRLTIHGEARFGRLRMLDQDSYAVASNSPQAFVRSSTSSELRDCSTIDLLPFGYGVIDYE